MLKKHLKSDLFHSIASFQLITKASNYRRAFCTIHAKTCYYEVLNVRSNATSEEIKKAYYEKGFLLPKLNLIFVVKQFHPDKNQTASAEVIIYLITFTFSKEHFKIIAKAYEILKDPNARKHYDATKNFKNSNSGPSSQGFASGSSYSYNYNHNYGSTRTAAGDYAYSETWQSYKDQRNAETDEKVKEKYYQSYQTQSSSSNESSGLLVKVAVVAGFFILLSLWNSTKKKNVSVSPYPSMIVNPVLPENVQKPIPLKDVQKEIDEKKFKIEHRTVQVYVSPEAMEARKIYKKEKKIVNLDEFVDKKNVKLYKSDQH